MADSVVTPSTVSMRVIAQGAKLTDWQVRLLQTIECLQREKKSVMLIVDGPALLIYRLEPAGRHELNQVVVAK